VAGEGVGGVDGRLRGMDGCFVGGESIRFEDGRAGGEGSGEGGFEVEEEEEEEGW